MLVVELIKKKRDGGALSQNEIEFLIDSYLKGSLSDYQMSALLMSIYFRGMSPEETLHLTQAMLHSGDSVDFSYLNKFCVDKHSTGGIGDKTSLILAPLVASLGIPVPMISGRGLGHTGGTLDKLESIPGFNTQLSLDIFKNLIEKHNLALIGQTPEICPADKRMYALRDVTGTVESLPLICASIMSKKLAEGIHGLVLDVKFGSGAFMKSYEQALGLAEGLISIAKGAGKKVTALLTNMNQPLGAFAGNSLEIEECVAILKNELPSNPSSKKLYLETQSLSLELASHMMALATNRSPGECLDICTKQLASGKAYEKFEEIVKAQGGNLKSLPQPKQRVTLTSLTSGYLHRFDVEKLGWINVALGAGRKQVTDSIEPTAGMEFHFKIGEALSQGDPLITLYGQDAKVLESYKNLVLETILIEESPLNATPFALIKKVLQ